MSDESGCSETRGCKSRCSRLNAPASRNLNGFSAFPGYVVRAACDASTSRRHEAMTGHELRHQFLEFFKSHDHAIVPSSGLIPKNDPTLLFTNAGMVQFKDTFLGVEPRAYSRATTAQKCVRAGGKHNDLENVGRTARHHTFFEMMGNFSFGDYFKKDAIQYAWEFLTDVLKLPEDALYATVYLDDDEAFDLWRNVIGLPADRVIRLGEKDNFWSMGDTGPCGPCSEIIIDQGAEMRCGPDCGLGVCDCDRFLELWNLVFMQYDRDEAGTLTPLPRPSIDTGMGLERVAAVLQGVQSNFDSDLFAPMLRFVEECAGKRYGGNADDDTSMRVIADHLRSITFLISDGVMPSNEGRGYVLRRIMRRAARHGKILGLTEPFLHNGIVVVVEAMKDAYPELPDNANFVKQVTLNEERRFGHTLNQGIERLNALMDDTRRRNKTVLDGTELFRLYDTFGFPIDLTQDIAVDHGFTLDMDGFEREMQAQRTRAQKAWKGSGDQSVETIFKELSQSVPATRFIGYEALETDDAKVLAIVKENAAVDEAVEGERVQVVLDVTPCYGESGGQVGDTGTLRAVGGACEAVMTNTTKPVPSIFVHHVTVKRGTLRCGDAVAVAVDATRRQRIRLNHTTTHLLHAALRDVLGDHVKQSGSLVSPERLRFDFTHFSAVDDQDMQRIERIVNDGVRANIGVTTTEASLDEALNMGAIAFFEDKYGDFVRVVQVPGHSMELCGGTHVGATGEIGLCKILSESSVAAGVRRIEAVTGEAALDQIEKEEQELRKTSGLLKAAPQDVSDKVERLLASAREAEKEVERLRMQLATIQVTALVEQAREIGGVKVVAAQLDNLDAKGLRNVADVVRGKIGSGIVVLGTASGSRVALIAAVTQDLSKTYHAGKIIKELATMVGGSGGGRPDMAQAGGKDAENLPDALQHVFQIIEQRM